MKTDMTKTFKLRELSDQFCDLDRIADPDEQNRHYSQMRLLVQRRLIEPTSPDIGRGSVARYALDTACKARLLMTLHRGDFDHSVLRNANNVMSKGYLQSKARAGRIPATEIAAAIEAVLEDRGVIFEFAVRRHWQTGKREVTGGFYLDDENLTKARELLDAWGSVVQTISLPASSLLRPFFENLSLVSTETNSVDAREASSKSDLDHR